MLGAKGFRTREATANYKRRIRKLVPDEVRAARFANLHGNDEPELETVEPEAEVEVTAETQPEQTEAQADEAADEAGDEGEGDSEETPDTEGKAATPKKKASKAKKKSE
ncbi:MULTISPECIES: hypothetical protein [Bradyrhizobium]|jgi:hypothetical protein|uniref:Uncharacterized protein n=1 Tax=Bradyrhizobium elkanii TaxID=29448 RepID=A0A8I1YCX9_BRAEL|nr:MULTISPECIES: hypothetical protein [Bradyrhizobium]MBP1297117.1 hypothetical protein [Bradyrhizobium elkanii]MCP1932121.1 hypothetical protein [Bradyrhizobium elkanii]MCS3577337.1 hypothetical protein [Bradyrhizobium elkanii]MCS3720213.1 hypothetical protein [Bradyrhizobium elkanii]MCS3881163.1 hypothetical protein [Bradyrhizobium elkanii]